MTPIERKAVARELRAQARRLRREWCGMEDVADELEARAREVMRGIRGGRAKR